LQIDSRLQDQYSRIFTVAPAAPEVAGESVIKLFDE
jgi:hypothetical protein